METFISSRECWLLYLHLPSEIHEKGLNIWKDWCFVFFLVVSSLPLMPEIGEKKPLWKVSGREFNVATCSSLKVLKPADLNSVQSWSVNNYTKELDRVITELWNITRGASLETDGNSGELIMVIKGSIYLKCTEDEPRNYLPANFSTWNKLSKNQSANTFEITRPWVITSMAL